MALHPMTSTILRSHQEWQKLQCNCTCDFTQSHFQCTFQRSGKPTAHFVQFFVCLFHPQSHQLCDRLCITPTSHSCTKRQPSSSRARKTRKSQRIIYQSDSSAQTEQLCEALQPFHLAVWLLSSPVVNGRNDMLWQLVYFTSQAELLLFMSNEQSSTAHTVKHSHRREPTK